MAGLPPLPAPASGDLPPDDGARGLPGLSPPTWTPSTSSCRCRPRGRTSSAVTRSSPTTPAGQSTGTDTFDSRRGKRRQPDHDRRGDPSGGVRVRDRRRRCDDARPARPIRRRRLLGVFDCVSWGNFSGALPSPAGSPRPTRRHPGRDGAAPDDRPRLPDPARGRATTATTASRTSPKRLPDAPLQLVTPPSIPVPPPPRDGWRPTSGGAPQTSFKRKPAKTTRDRTPTFRFGSSEPDSTFQCKLDGKPFRACYSPYTPPGSPSAGTPSRSAPAATRGTSTPPPSPTPSRWSRSASGR